MIQYALNHRALICMTRATGEGSRSHCVGKNQIYRHKQDGYLIPGHLRVKRSTWRPGNLHIFFVALMHTRDKTTEDVRFFVQSYCPAQVFQVD
ncbi:hypothetical protein FKM82_003607 [Ascaphus truei]